MPLDSATQVLTIPENITDLTPANPDDDGSTEKAYNVVTTVTVTAADGTEKTESITTVVTIKDPCIDTGHVNIIGANLARLDYTVFDDAEPKAAHTEFSV